MSKADSLQPILHLNLRPFFVIGLWVILFFSPFFRGLFFQPELLMVHMLTGVVFALCVYDQVLRREVAFKFSGLEWALLALVAAYLLSLITAVHLRPAVGEVLKVIGYLMIFWIAFRTVRTERDLDRVLLVTYVGAMGVALVGIAAAAGVFNFPGAYVGDRIYSTLQYPNTLGIFLAMLSVVGVALSVKTDRLLPKLLFAAGGVILITVLLGTQSRGSWMLYPFMLGGFVIVMPEVYRWRAAYHILIQLGCGLFAARGFFNHLQAGEPVLALWYLVGGVALALGLQFLYHLLGLWLNRESVPATTRRLVAMGGVGYFGLVLALYIAYAAAAMPTPAGQVLLAEDVFQRAETITVHEPSFQARLVWSRDALRIVGDYPLTGAGGGGWNALYHQYQSYLYWTTEVHNHYLQVWVEAGTLGLLAMLAVWGFFAHLLVRFWRSGVRSGLWVSTWAAAVAVLGLGVHSAFDFNLSMAAMGLLLWAYFGLVRGGTELAAAEDADHPAGVGEAGAGQRRKLETPSDKVPGVSSRWLVGIALGGTLVAAALVLPALSFYSAGKIGAEGARALLREDFDQAAVHLRAAAARDPFTASYPGDLAQIYAVRALTEDDAVAHYRALDFARRAAELEPFRIRVRSANLNVYNLLREPNLVAAEAEALLRTNPLLLFNYEILARTYLAAVRYSIERDDRELAREYLQKVLDLPERITARAELLRPGEASRWLLAAERSASLQLVFGQAHFLRGAYGLAEQYLQAASGHQDLKSESELWLAALYIRQGEGERAQEILSRLQTQQDEAEQLLAEILALSPL
jgi:O-antigen ligase